MESHCYLVIENKHAIVIDPGDAELASTVINEKGLQVDFGILTHEHCDHIYGCTELQEELGIPFYASFACDRNMRSVQKNFSRYYEAFVSVQTKIDTEKEKMMSAVTAKADRTFDGVLLLEWKGHEFYLRETPGHSPGSICILTDDWKLFAGDTLLAEDLTSFRFTGGSREKLMEETLPWLKTLPAETVVFPGHGPSFRLGERLDKPIVEERKHKGETNYEQSRKVS